MIGSKIYRLATCASTNDAAKALALAGAEDGTVVIAGGQTGGRGTKGRAWHSAGGLGLYASVILRPSRRDLALVPVAAALAVADAVKLAAGLETRLKWPNDVVWRGLKIAGVLSESAFLGDQPSYVVVGMGVNVRHRRRDFPAEIIRSATSLRLAVRRTPRLQKLERALWEALDDWFGRFAGGADPDLIAAFGRRLDPPVGSTVTVERGGESVRGVLRGLDARARLVLETESGVLLLSAADIVSVQPYSLRP